jgi:hypothetical protein
MGIGTPVGCGQQADRCCSCSWFSILSTEERKSFIFTNSPSQRKNG